MIPKLIHSVWLEEVSDLPPRERKFLNKWQKLNPTYGMMLWGTTEIEAFIQRFYPEYFALWGLLENVGKRADFARCLILAKYGGFYVDPDQEPLKGLDEFLSSPFIYSRKDRRTIEPSHLAEPVNFKIYDIIIGSDNYSVRPTLSRSNIITNCFIGSVPSRFWSDFIEHQAPFFKSRVLNSFGTWALTDYIRKVQPPRLMELPSYYFNWIPKHMGDKEPFDYTHSLHHSAMSWVDEGGDWYSQE